MSSGKRQSVLVFCASLFDGLYLPSICHYDPDEVYAFIGTGDDVFSSISRRVYESSRRDIPCRKVTECRLDIHDYEAVLSAMMDIKGDLAHRFGDDLDLYVDISSGTNVFAAAAMFASMVPKRAVAYRVDIDDPGIGEDDALDLVLKMGRGFEASEPVRMTSMQNKEPDDDLIAFLRILDGILKETKYPKYSVLIQRLKDSDSWSYDPHRKSGGGRTPLDVKEERYLKRHYIDCAMGNGWVEKPTPNRLVITEAGRAYLSVYGGDELRCNLHADGVNEVRRTASLRMASSILTEGERLHDESSGVCEVHVKDYDPSRRFDDEEIPALYDHEEECDDDPEVIGFERDGKTYRFRVGLE